MDEIIQGDVKWFRKHCACKESDSVAPMEELINEVQKKFQEIQEKKVPCRHNFSNVAHIEAMLIINLKHLEMHEEKVIELKREKEVLKRRIAYIDLPHQSVILAFTTAYETWKAERTAIGADRSS